MFITISLPNPSWHISVRVHFDLYSYVFVYFFLSLPSFGSPFALSSFFVFLSFCFFHFHFYYLFCCLLHPMYSFCFVLYYFAILSFSVFKLLAYYLNLTAVKLQPVNSHWLKSFNQYREHFRDILIPMSWEISWNRAYDHSGRQHGPENLPRKCRGRTLWSGDRQS